MGKYDKFKKLVIPLSIAKNTVTTALPGLTGKVTIASPGNEGIELGEWINERILDGTVISSTNLSYTQTNTTVTIYSDTGNDAIIPSATTVLAGVMSAQDKTYLNSLVTLSGVSGGSNDLGTFSGSIISDNTTIKNALQQLESAIGSGGGGGGNGIYGGPGVVPATVVATLTDNITFTTSTSGGYFLANSGNLFGSYLLVSDTQAKLQYYDLSSINQVIVNSGGIQFNTTSSDRVLITGLDARYFADYSAFYSNLSLVHKGYVDALIPSGSLGSTLIHNGTSYTSVTPITESRSGLTGLTVTLGAIPKTYAPFMLFRNGVFQTITDDFTLSGSTLTFVSQALISTDKLVAIYYI